MHIETDCLRLCRSLTGHAADAGRVDVIPLAIVEYAEQKANEVDVLTAKFVASESGVDNVARHKKSSSRSPMALPQNREHLTTEEFAAALVVEPQSVRKRYSETGSYHDRSMPSSSRSEYMRCRWVFVTVPSAAFGA